MNVNYWTLYCRDGGKWSPQFGSYTRKEVAEEERLTYARDYRAFDRVIVKTGDGATAIDEMGRLLNMAKVKRGRAQ